MVVDQAFSDERSVVPDDAGECSQVLGDLRVALMRHGNTANSASYKTLADFTDFGTLQVINLVPDLVASGSNQRKQIEPLGQRVTGGYPRNRRCHQSKPCQEALLQFQRAWP